jgi:hypothetical protein
MVEQTNRLAIVSITTVNSLFCCLYEFNALLNLSFHTISRSK